MSRRTNKKCTWIMLVTFMLSFTSYIYWPIESVEAATPSQINGYPNKCKYNPSVDGEVPDGVAPCSLPSDDNKNGFKFNSKFYYDSVTINNNPKKVVPARKIIVYGSPASVPSKIQSFKKGWQPNGGTQVINPEDGEGHSYVYSSDYGKSVYGEYRYLGYTYDNNLYSNINFIIDMDVGIPVKNKHWIYMPWKELPDSYARKPATPGAVYNGESNVQMPEFEPIGKYVVERLGFKITQGVKYAERYKILSEEKYQDPRLYMSIHQEPTTKERGMGTMYHYSWDSNSIWYQTFFLPQLSHNKKPVEAACAVEPVSDKPIQIGKSKKVKVDVKLTGTLLDEAYFGNKTDEFYYYTRQDVKYWRLDVRDQSTGDATQLFSDKPKDGVIVQNNTANAIFTIEIDTDKLDRTNDEVWKYKTNAGVFAYFYDTTESKTSRAFTYCNLVVNVDPSDKQNMRSDFNVVPEIQFDRASQFVRSMVGYQDLSYGDDVDYYEYEIVNADDKTTATKMYDPAKPGVKAPKTGYLDQTSVNNFLYDFMKSKFSNEVSTQKVVRTFHLKQTIVDRDSTTNNKSVAMKTVVVMQHPEALTCEMQPSPPKYITPQADWPLDWYDVVPFPVTDAAPSYIPSKGCEDPVGYEDFEKRVFIDGKEINANTFYKGDYIFGEDQLGIRAVKTTFTAPDGTESYKLQHVVIHESKPRVSFKMEGLYKQNRTMKAIDRSAASNDQWVEQNSPLEITSFSYVKPTDSNLKCRTGYCESNKAEKMFMYKETGHYQMSIAAKRVITYGGGKTITRYSDPYLVDYEIMPDHKPALIAHAYNSEISRLDELALLHDVVSTDGDLIAEQSMKVYYDADNDGEMDTLVYETDEANITQLPKLDKLGQYEIVVYAKEGTNQDRLMEFITPADNKTHTVRSYFFIDNYAPASDLYLDIPNEKAEMDVYFMLDANLKQTSTDYVRSNKVTLTNAFTTANMLANIGIWDMKTYTYDQSASTSDSTGTSYPSNTLYYSNNGYSGTLSRTSVSNTPYEIDEGKFKSVTDHKTGSDSCSNTVTASYDKDGRYSSSDTNMCPDSKNISDGNYSGTVYRGSASTSQTCPSDFGKPNTSCTRTYTAPYSGTLYWTRDVWEPKMVTYDSYTGYYSGTIYKDIRQPYDAHFMSAVPTKYVVYISDNGATQLSDLQNVMNKHNAQLILVGSSAIESQITHDKYMANNDTIENMVNKVIQYIGEHNPANPKVLKLVGEEIETATATFDVEKDPTPDSEDQLQITQDPYVYDNSMGFDSLNGKSFISDKSAANWQPYQSKLTLNKPGKYQFMRRIKDLPSTDLNFKDYSYYSNESIIDVYVHRKPIPDVTLDFDYDLNANRYRTTWVDMSYDLDHNITRAATDRGIQARSIKLTNQGTGEVYTKIPTSVDPGTYVLDYLAQDIEGVWSDPLQRTYVLPATVPLQMKSNLKTTYNGFSLNSVPASEGLTAYELWTRYPYSLSLQLTMGSYINKTVTYYTGTKSGNDIQWANENLVIPNTTPDGTYTFTIRGNGSVAGSNATHTYTVKVITPIKLSGRIDAMNSAAKDVDAIVVGDTYSLVADTTKYPDQSFHSNATVVTLFKGTVYQRVVTLSSKTESVTGYGKKNWSGSFKPSGIPDGSYVFEWRSRTPNGNIETVTKTVNVVNNRPPTADFTWEPQPVYEGDTVSFIPVIQDLDGDTLAVSYVLTSPSGVVREFAYSLQPPYSHDRPQHRMVEPGNWRMKLTVSDGKAAPVTVEKQIEVKPLQVIGAVSHTELWNDHRQAYNRKRTGNPESPRGYSVFWAGEKFLLQAETTATGTLTLADRVEVAFGDFSTTLSVIDASNMIWKGELWDKTFEELHDGPAVFAFTAYYSNGTIKTTEVTIQFLGGVSQILGVHRVK